MITRCGFATPPVSPCLALRPVFREGRTTATLRATVGVSGSAYIALMPNAEQDCQRSPRFCHWLIEAQTFHVCMLVSSTTSDHLGAKSWREYMLGRV